MADKSHEALVKMTSIDLRMDSHLVPSALRAFLGATPLDNEIDDMAVPERPYWLIVIVSLLRFYRRIRPARVSQRCVFDPSCSRYSEMAFRKHGASKGLAMTLLRLQRCRPGAGGTDIP